MPLMEVFCVFDPWVWSVWLIRVVDLFQVMSLMEVICVVDPCDWFVFQICYDDLLSGDAFHWGILCGRIVWLIYVVALYSDILCCWSFVRYFVMFIFCQVFCDVDLLSDILCSWSFVRYFTILLFCQVMPLITSLRNPALQPRHWTAIYKTTG